MSYLYALCLIIGLGILILRRTQKKQQEAEEEPKQIKAQEDCEHTGCGTTCFCDDQAIKRTASSDIIYFEDEELDVFKGKTEDEYTDNETELFSEVLTTLRPEEIPDWLHSLELRGIALPATLKDEVVMLLQE